MVTTTVLICDVGALDSGGEIGSMHTVIGAGGQLIMVAQAIGLP